MIPLSTLMDVKRQPGTEITNRFNLFRSAEISGVPAPGYTSGQALAALEDVFKKTMPARAELRLFLDVLSGEGRAARGSDAGDGDHLRVSCCSQRCTKVGGCPGRCLLGSPLVVLGSFFGVWLMGYDNNVYVQIGNIMLIGLAAKNAILIVEFAKAKQDDGMDPQEAALESARLRFRPILMTAFAFILGVIPLMRAEGRRRCVAERDGLRGVLRHARRDSCSASS